MSCGLGSVVHGLEATRHSIAIARAALQGEATVPNAGVDAITQAVGSFAMAQRDAQGMNGIGHLAPANSALTQAAGAMRHAPAHCIDALLARADEPIASHLARWGELPHTMLECPELAMTGARFGPATAHQASRLLGQELPGGARIAEHGHANPLGTRWDSASKVAEARGRAARDDLAEVFAPMALDAVNAMRASRDVPLGELPRFGRPVEAIGAVKPTLATESSLEDNLALPVEHLRTAHGALRSNPPMGTRTVGEPGAMAQVAVGEYGPKLAGALVEAARIMNGQLMRSVDPVAAEALGASREQLLQRWVFQGTDIRRTFVEGVNTYADSYALLTSQRIAGMDEHELLDALESGRVVERLAKLPQGIVGPLNTNRVFPADNLVEANGRLRLGASWDALVDSVKQRQSGVGTTLPTTGAGCPLANVLRDLELPGMTETDRTESFITALNREYLHLVRRLLDDDATTAATAEVATSLPAAARAGDQPPMFARESPPIQVY